MFLKSSKSKVTYFVVLVYLVLLIWWTTIYSRGLIGADENNLFGLAYTAISLVGGINGLMISKQWGGFKSHVGRGIGFLSLGLLGQWFGQTAWSYFTLVSRVEVPYPSIADAGYFAIIPFYALGMYYFAKAAGAKFSLKKGGAKLYAFLIPVVMVIVAYALFLKGYEFDFTPDSETLWGQSAPYVRVFLDFGYPLGEAFPISIALVTYGLAYKLLGGQMKSKILYLIVALVFAYVTDYTFLYRVANETYYNGGPVDLMYATSFAIMALGINLFKLAPKQEQAQPSAAAPDIYTGQAGGASNE